MIDPPACDGCDYQIQMANRMGCDFRQLCRDAIAIINDDDNQMHHLQMIVEEYEKTMKHETNAFEELIIMRNMEGTICHQRPLVRCKDCEHSKSYSNGKMFGCEFGNGLREPDWFCADGVREER